MSETKDPPPYDYMAPMWEKYEKVHGWRNYVSDEVQAMWNTFTPEQRAALARQADDMAGMENWE